MFHSPTTRGLDDPTTSVYWASDAFASPMLTPVRDVAELDSDLWTIGMATFGHDISPWLELVDDRRERATVDRVETLHPTMIAACHTPTVAGRFVADAIDIARRTPTMTVPAPPDQSALDQIHSTLIAAA